MNLLTASRIKLAHACPRAQHYRYELGLRAHATSPALAFGTAIHAGLEAWWNAIREGAPELSLSDAFFALDRSDLDDPFEHARAEAMLTAYDVRWRRWACGVDVLAAEAEFRAPLREPGTGRVARTWELAGKMDALVRLADGRVAIVEHKCLHGDARIFNHDSGLYERAEDLCDRGIAPRVTAMLADGTLTVTKALPIRRAGARPIYRITTREGRTLRVSGNHPIWTQRGWVRADEVTRADWVGAPRHLECSAPDARITDEEIRLIGYMIGDGSIGRMSFTKTDAVVRGDFVRCAESIGEKPSQYFSDVRAPWIRLSVAASAPGVLLMKRARLDGELSATKRAPLHLGFSDRQLGQLVGALWSTDGCIDTHGKKLRIIYTSRSRGLCEDLQHALQRLGIVSSVQTTTVGYKGERREVSTAQVISREGKRRFLTLALSGVIPVLRSVPLTTASQFIPDSRQGEDTRGRPPPSPTLWWDRVSDVVLEPDAMTYDVEVPEAHTFVVDGVVTHNTTSRDAGAGTDYRRKLTLDPQISVYHDGAAAALGYEADLCLYDVLVKPSQKPLLASPELRLKKDGTPRAGQRERDESPKEYRERLVETIASDPARYLIHAEIVRTERDREEHALDVWETVFAIEHHRRRLPVLPPRHASACFAHGAPCEFLGLCEGRARIEDYARGGAHAELTNTNTNTDQTKEHAA